MEEKILLKFFKGNNEQSLKNTTIQPNCFYYVKDNYGLNIFLDPKDKYNLTSFEKYPIEEIKKSYSEKNYFLQQFNEYFVDPTSIIVPEGVTSLKMYLNDSFFYFVNNTYDDIKRIVLPSTLTNIPSNCFRRTYNKIFDFSKCKNKIPTLQENSFSSFSETNAAVILVPKGQLDNWKNATNWSLYANYMQEGE